MHGGSLRLLHPFEHGGGCFAGFGRTYFQKHRKQAAAGQVIGSFFFLK
jgi:hypothetical protein